VFDESFTAEDVSEESEAVDSDEEAGGQQQLANGKWVVDRLYLARRVSVGIPLGDTHRKGTILCASQPTLLSQLRSSQLTFLSPHSSQPALLSTDTYGCMCLAGTRFAGKGLARMRILGSLEPLD
jgi:hypothetical protein